MKWNPFVLAWVAAPALALSWSAIARAQEASASCINDIDCTGGGTACGTEVCDWNMGKICVPAATASLQDNWCGDTYAMTYDQATADMECKCHAEGATCVNFHCTIWFLDAGSDSASGATSSGSTPTGDSAASDGGSSGGCSVALGGENSPIALGVFGFVGCVAATRRRKRS